MNTLNADKNWVAARNIMPRWNVWLSGVVNLMVLAAVALALWWLFFSNSGMFKLYTPLLGFSLVIWMLLIIIWQAEFFDYWPFSSRFLRNAHPLKKGGLLAGTTLLLYLVMIFGVLFFIIGKFGVTYFNWNSLAKFGKLGQDVMSTRETTSWAFICLSVPFLWITTILMVGVGKGIWPDDPQPRQGLANWLLMAFVSIPLFLVFFHPHIGSMFYPAQIYTAVPPWWKQVAQTNSAEFGLGILFCSVIVIFITLQLWEGRPWNLVQRQPWRFLTILVGGLVLGFLFFIGTVAQGNVGEFVKFIPGVQVDYGGTYSTGADAASISVRGFRPDQTAVTIDGIPVSNAQPGSLTRAIGLDMLSINNASRVEVIKVPTPDQPSASIGGSVNLISKSAFEYPKPTFSFRVYFGLNSQNLDVFEKTPGPMNKKTFKALPGIDLTYALPLNEKLGFTFTLATANQFNENHTAKSDYKVDADLELPLFIDEDGNEIGPVFADVAHPYLNNFGITDGPRVSHRHSASIKMDYIPWDGHLLTLNYQVSVFESADAQRRFELNAGGTAGIAAYGPHFLESRPGKGKAEQNVTALDKEGNTQTAYIRWEFNKGPWHIRSHYSTSVSDGEYISTKNGHFSEVQLNMGGIHKAYFNDIYNGIPGDIVYYDEDGNELDETRLENYSITGYLDNDPQASRLRVLSGESLSKSEFTSAKFDIRRELDFLPLDRWMSLAFKTGVDYEERLEEKWGKGTTYGFQYLGASGVTLDVSDFLDTGYRNVSPGFGFPAREWPDVYKVYKYYKDNPSAFSDTHDEPVFEAQDDDGVINDLAESSIAYSNWDSYVSTQKRITDEKFSHYWQLEGKFFNNRLNVVGGMRQSRSDRTGRGPYRDHDWRFLRSPDDVDGDGTIDYPILSLDTFGALDLTAPMPSHIADLYEEAGAVYPDGTPFHANDAEEYGVTLPRVGTTYYRGTRVGPGDADFVGYVVPGSLQASQYEKIPNYEVDETSKGKASPIISSAYDLFDNVVLKVSWSRTFAPADYEGSYGILQRVEIDRDQDGIGGTISTSNPALKPWTSDNWDFGISYYTPWGGQISFSYFTKSIEDFHITKTYEEGDPEYLAEMAAVGFGENSIYVTEGWDLTKPVNGDGTATTDGYEIEIRHDLSFLGNWGRDVYLYGSWSTKSKSGNQNETSQIGVTSDDLAAGGISWDWNRFSARVNATWRSLKINSSSSQYLWPDPSVGDPTPDGPSEEDEQYEVGFIRFEPAELKVDVNLAYRLSERYQIDFSAKNVTNTETVTKYRAYGGAYPSYGSNYQRKDFGVNFTIGFSGRF